MKEDRFLLRNGKRGEAGETVSWKRGRRREAGETVGWKRGKEREERCKVEKREGNVWFIYLSSVLCVI